MEPAEPDANTVSQEQAGAAADSGVASSAPGANQRPGPTKPQAHWNGGSQIGIALATVASAGAALSFVAPWAQAAAACPLPSVYAPSLAGSYSGFALLSGFLWFALPLLALSVSLIALHSYALWRRRSSMGAAFLRLGAVIGVMVVALALSSWIQFDGVGVGVAYFALALVVAGLGDVIDALAIAWTTTRNPHGPAGWWRGLARFLTASVGAFILLAYLFAPMTQVTESIGSDAMPAEFEKALALLRADTLRPGMVSCGVTTISYGWLIIICAALLLYIGVWSLITPVRFRNEGVGFVVMLLAPTVSLACVVAIFAASAAITQAFTITVGNPGVSSLGGGFQLLGIFMSLGTICVTNAAACSSTAGWGAQSYPLGIQSLGTLAGYLLGVIVVSAIITGVVSFFVELARSSRNGASHTQFPGT